MPTAACSSYKGRKRLKSFEMGSGKQHQAACTPIYLFSPKKPALSLPLSLSQCLSPSISLSPGQQIIYIFSRARHSPNIEFSVEDIKGRRSRARSCSSGDRERGRGKKKEGEDRGEKKRRDRLSTRCYLKHVGAAVDAATRLII